MDKDIDDVSERKLINVLYYCFAEKKPYTIKEIYDMYQNDRNSFNILYALCVVEADEREKAIASMNKS